MSKRSRNVKNLEEAVESVFSQDDSDEDCEAVLDENQKFSRTPSQTKKFNEVTTQKLSQSVLYDNMQTPRRSCRKSVKPAQDYEDIVKPSLRYSTRSAKKRLSSEMEYNGNSDHENSKPKWTPAKVGRFSEKRSRKSKRTGKRNDQYGKKAEQVEGEKNKEETIEVKYILQNAEKDIGTLEAVNDKLDEIDQVNQSEQILKTSISIEHGIVENIQKLENFNKIDKEANLNIHNKCVSLIQEDAETTDESTEKSEQEEICIIYENNISNMEIKVNKELEILSKSHTSVSSEDEDSFGCYLKAKKINLSDLGLNPIKQEEENEKNFHNLPKTSSEEVEEMPSLIICDDEEEITSKTTEKINATFDTVENAAEIDKCLKQNVEEMETLQLSDDDCTIPSICPQIFLTDINGQNITILSATKKDPVVRSKTSPTYNGSATKMPSTPKRSIQKSAITSKLPITPKAVSAKLPNTPQQTKKINRFPTPYKNRNFKLNDEAKENIPKTSSRLLSDASLISITTLEPKEIVLRGIRKRSLSLCINEKQGHKLIASPLDKQKQNRIVSFFSPANQTTLIDDLDMVIAKSLKKPKNQENESLKKYVTTRRKRSISLDESIMSSSFASKLPRPVPGQNAKNKMQNSSLSKPLKRTKLPNFAAIHEKHFNKMENLVEHVHRKQERSKNLVNSATKLFPAATQKNVSLNKNTNNISAKKPSALKKSDLNPKSQNIEKSYLIAKSVTQKKPAFNLSTSLNVKTSTYASNIVEKQHNTSHINNDNKVTSRLQRHMELFKGRATSARAGLEPRKNQAVLKGVRSNRRFDLQMQHRKNLEQ